MMSAIVSERPEAVIIEVSGEDIGTHRKVKGAVQELVGKSLTLLSDEDIAVSAGVRVQTKDLLVLGEVLSCVADHPAKWTVYVSIKRASLII